MTKRIVLSWLLSVSIFSPTSLVEAQVSPETRIELQLLPQRDQAYVDLDDFPASRVTFWLLENGKHFQGTADPDRFSLFEDDQIVPISAYSRRELPLDITVILELKSYEDLATIVPSKTIAQEVWRSIQGDDRPRLCFTLGPDSVCVEGTGKDFEMLFERFRETTIEQELVGPAALSRLLQQTIVDARTTGQQPVIVLIRDQANMGKTPDIPQGFLEQVRSRNGLFVMIDELANPAYRDDLATYLETFEAFYYPYRGLPEDSSCYTCSECTCNRIREIRIVEHTLKFRSTLFVDGEEHRLGIRFDPGDGRPPVSASTVFFTRPGDSPSSLRTSVRLANTLITLLAPLLLMLILVLVKMQQKDGD